MRQRWLKTVLWVTSGLVSVILLAGCGQKGPLYLPGPGTHKKHHDNAAVYKQSMPTLVAQTTIEGGDRTS